MRRLVIAIDCDDVLVRTTPYFVEAYNKKYGTHASLEYARDPAPEIWGAKEDVVLKRWASLTETDEYKQLHPDPEEATILHELALHHELHLVTARKPEERNFTQAMLDRDLAGVFTSMEFVGWAGSKGQVVKRIGADVLIDDNASHLHDAIDHGLPAGGAILFGEYPWNANDSNHKDLTYLYDWASVKRAIDNIAHNTRDSS